MIVKFDPNNLLMLIGATLLVCIPLCIAIIYLSKPIWAYVVTSDDQQKLSWGVIICVSIAISFVVAVAVILFFTGKRGGPAAPSYIS